MFIMEFVIPIIIFLILVFLLQRACSQNNYPPGPTPLPLIGNLIDLFRANASFPHLALAKLADKYGDVMSLKLGSHQFVVLSSLESMNAILNLDETIERYEFQFVFERSFNQNLGLIWSNGDRWKQIRRFTLRKLRDFGLGKRDQMDEIIRAEVRSLTENMKTEILKQEVGRGHDSGGVFHMDSYFALAVVNCLWKLVAGSSFGLSNERAQKMMDYNYEVVDAIALNKLCVTIPILGTMFPKLTGKSNQTKAFKELQDFMRELIDESRARKDCVSNPQSFIDLFLREMQTNQESTYYTEEELIMTLKDLFLGGSETSSHTLSFGVLYLLLNKDVQTKVQQELALVIPKGMDPSLSDLPRMPYTQATILEISRCGDVIPLPAPRRAIKSFTYKHYEIPKGAALTFNMHCVFQSKEIWGDPENFRPERFLDENNRLINTEKFPLFGFGKRFCMGEGLARNTMFHFLVGLLQQFTFEPVPGKRPNTDVRPGSHTLCPFPFDVLMKIKK